MSDFIDKVVITIRYYAGENIRVPKCLENANKPCWIVEMDEIVHHPRCVDTLEEARIIANEWKRLILNAPSDRGVALTATVEIVEQTE